LIVEGYFERKT